LIRTAHQPKGSKRGSKWIQKGAAKLGLFVLALKLHLIREV
jgi:hypothetical protein